MTIASFVHDETQVAPPSCVRTDLDDGSFVLSSRIALEPYARCVGEWLERWVAETPETIALAERGAAGASWRTLSYRELRQQVGAVAQALLDMDLPPQRPIVILSDNALDHAVLALAAQHLGRTSCSLSSGYSRTAGSFARLHGCLDALQPALIYASDAEQFGRAIAGYKFEGPRVFSRNAELQPQALSFERLLRVRETPAVLKHFHAIAPDDHAKYLLTSGSTGQPKIVINTHRMLCANQQMMVQTWRFLKDEKPVIVDWLPWSHTFGGNHNFHMVLCHGGSLYIDEGRPTPALIDKTLRNLREVQPTLLFNVPRGYEMMLPYLEADPALARDVLARTRLAFYAAAALAPSTWQRLEAVAQRARPERPLWRTTSWGSTETAPAVTSAHWPLDGPGSIGGPLPGLELKFVPDGDKLEMRVKGVSVFPGYRGAPRATADAFDEQGFYRSGDAGYLLDPQRPERGAIFDGRVAEDFKLSTGTWVSVGTLRVELVSRLAPLAQDIVISGHGRHEIGMLVFPSPQAASTSPEAWAAALRGVMIALREAGAGSSRCPSCALVLRSPPDIEAGEITDKGYINQRAVLVNRSAEVERLHGGTADPDVIRLP